MEDSTIFSVGMVMGMLLSAVFCILLGMLMIRDFKIDLDRKQTVTQPAYYAQYSAVRRFPK